MVAEGRGPVKKYRKHHVSGQKFKLYYHGTKDNINFIMILSQKPVL